MKSPPFALEFLLVLSCLTWGCQPSTSPSTDSHPTVNSKEKPATAVAESSSSLDKSVRELTPEELTIVNSICQKVLKDYLGDKVVDWAQYTLNRFPEHIFGTSKGEKLLTSITFVSVYVSDSVYDSEEDLKSKLKERVVNQGASRGGRRYQISESMVLVESAPGDQSLVTILPIKVTIY